MPFSAAGMGVWGKGPAFEASCPTSLPLIARVLKGTMAFIPISLGVRITLCANMCCIIRVNEMLCLIRSEAQE